MTHSGHSLTDEPREHSPPFGRLTGLGAFLLALLFAPADFTFAALCGEQLVDDVHCPSDNGTDDPGSVLPGLLPRAVGGNPISFLTGNKRQSETDYAVPGRELVFNRHYNSLNGDWNAGIGQGWQHSYAVTLFDAGSGIRHVVQSDGRRLRFEPVGTDDAGREILGTGAANEGQLVVDGNAHDWLLPDGRRLRFRGSFLTRIDWPDHRRLELFYRQRRLASVTDESGHRLRFAWTHGSVGLPKYGSDPFGEHKGHLASVTLPDGGVIAYDYDERQNLTRVRFPDGTSRRYHYDDPAWPHHLTGLSDRTGARFATWAYDEEGRATLSEHAGGVERITVEHPDRRDVDAGRVIETRVTNSHGATSAYAWQHLDAANAPRLLEASGAGCTTCPPTGRRYRYDATGRLASVTRDGARGAAGRTDYTRDELGRLVLVTREDENGQSRLVERRDYLGTSVTPWRIVHPSIDPDGERVVETHRDESGLPVRIVERGREPIVLPPTSGQARAVLSGWRTIERTVRLEYEAGRLVAIDGPRNDVADITRIDWDANRRPIAVRPPSGPTAHIDAFDAHGRPTRVRLGGGSPRELRYDAHGEIEAMTHRGVGIAFERDAEGRLVSYTDANGQVTRLESDPAGRLTSVTDPFGNLVRLTHDDESREVHRAHVGIGGELVRSLSTAYDELGRLKSSIDSRPGASDAGMSTRETRFEHDAGGQLLAAIDPASGARFAIDVDPLTGQTRLIRPDGTSTVHRRDALGQEAGLVDARGNETREYRNDFGWLVATDGPDSGLERMERDAAGNLVRRTRDGSAPARFLHDAANRLVERSSADGTTSWRYDDSHGKLAAMVGPATTERFVHDADGALLRHTREIDGHVFETAYERDSRGRIAVKRLPDGQVLRYRYHQSGPARGTLRAIERERYLGLSTKAVVEQIDLELRDGNAGWSAHNGKRTDIELGADGAVRAMRTDGVLELAYRFDTTDRIGAVKENGSESRYRYVSGRLVVAETPHGEFRYEYDRAGNRLARFVRAADDTVTLERYVHAPDGDGNRLLSRTQSRSGEVTRWRYGAGGVPITAGSFSYEYDAERRPTSVSGAGKLVATYAYNGIGERIRKVVHVPGEAPRITYFLYDGGVLSAEADASGTVLAQYVYLDDGRPIAKLEGRRTYAIHGDHLGTPRRMTDEAGVTVWSATYKPFGQATVTVEDVTLALRFPGQYADAETGTHYNRFRDYDPAVGRYLTADPIGLLGGPHAYAYAGLDPISFADPLGLFTDNPSFLVRIWRRMQAAATVSTALAAADGPVPIGDAAAALLLISTLDDAVTAELNALVFGHDVGLQDDYDFILEQIRIYDPGYADPRSPALAPRLDDLRDLSQALYDAQLRYLAEGTECSQHAQAASLGIEFADTLRQEISASGSSLSDWLEREFSDYRANGGELDSIADWMAAGMPSAEVDPALLNRVEHVFGPKSLDRHRLRGFLELFSGNSVEAYLSLLDAAQIMADSGDIIGVFETEVVVRGVTVTIRGRVIDGIVVISTAFIPPP